MFKLLFTCYRITIGKKYRYVIIILGLCLLYLYIYYMQIETTLKNMTIILYLVEFLVFFMFVLYMYSLTKEIRQNMLIFFDLPLLSKNQKNLYDFLYFFSLKVYFFLKIIFWIFIVIFFVKTYYINILTPKNFIFYVDFFKKIYLLFFCLFYVLVLLQFFVYNIILYKYIKLNKENLWILCCLIFILISSFFIV